MAWRLHAAASMAPNTTTVARESIVPNMPPSGHLVVGADLCIRSWSTRACHLFGYEAAQILDRPFHLLLPRGRGAEVENLLRVASTGNPVTLATRRLHTAGYTVAVVESIVQITAAAHEAPCVALAHRSFLGRASIDLIRGLA